MVVPCAQLRVFLPVDTLTGRAASLWDPDQALGTTVAREVEERVQRRRLLLGAARVPEGAVLVRRAAGRSYVCPLQHDLRCAGALRQLRADVHPVDADRVLGDSSLRERLDRVAAAGGRPTIVDAPWAVPVVWFVAFTDDERRLLDPPEGVGPRLRYTTTVGAAAARVDRAIDLVDTVGEAAVDVLDDLADLADWLGSFDPGSLLELDYGGLVQILPQQQLLTDHSARDLGEALDALEEGDIVATLAAYALVRGRWRRLQRAALTS